MSASRLAAIAVLAAACVNPPGEVLIRNQYTGPCPLEIKFSEENNDFVPIPMGTETTFDVENARLQYVGFRAQTMPCNDFCRFTDSQNFNLAACKVYAADSYPSTIDVINGAPLCGPGTERPTLVCTLGPP